MTTALRLLAVCLLAGTARQLAAQDPSLAIYRAATSDTSDKMFAYRIAGDTAWATIVHPQDIGLVPAQGGVPGREVRLQRRAGSWTVVATRPVVVPTPQPVRPAKPDTLPKRP